MPSRAVEPIGPIYGPHPAAQTFEATDAPLVGIDVRLATYSRRNNGQIILRLRSAGAQADLRVVEVDAASVGDNALQRFRFAPARPDPGASAWTFIVESTASDDRNGVAVWTAPLGAGAGRGSYDGTPLGADLSFAPLYQEPVTAAALAAVARLAAAPGGPLLAVLLLFVPGYLVARALLRGAALDLRVSAAPAFSVALVALLALYATPLGIVGRGLALAVVAGSVVGLGAAAAVALRSAGRPPGGARQWQIAVPPLGVFGAGLLVRAVAVSGSGVPPGADTYHHALITQLIFERGGLPTDYLPYAPIDSFAYHFGFHAFAALVAGGSGLAGVDAVAIAAPLLNAAAAPSIYFLARTSGMGVFAATVAATVAALVSPFPMQLLDLGRASQAAALVVLPVAVGLGVAATGGLTRGRQGDGRRTLAVALLAAGAFLTHYRVAIFLAVIVGIHVAWILLGGLRQARPGAGERSPSITEAGGGAPGAGPVQPLLPWGGLLLAILLVAPWLVRLGQQFTLGIRESAGRYAPDYYSLDRIADGIAHPAFWSLAVLAALGLVAAIAARRVILSDAQNLGTAGDPGTLSGSQDDRGASRVVLLLAAWLTVQLLLSNPYWLPVPFAGQVDTVTVVSSAFVPISLAVGYLSGLALVLLRHVGPRLAGPAGAVAIVAASLWGAVYLPPLVEPRDRLASAADVAAAVWAADNVPVGSRFLVNASIARWEPDFVLPTDGGYWLPLLAGRANTLLPMVYPAERGVSQQQVQRMEQLVRVAIPDPTTPQALALLRNSGVTHVYIGARGGPLSEPAIAASSAYRLVYRKDGVSIYEMSGAPG